MRFKFSFWLDDSKELDNTLMQEIAFLKQGRSFAKTIRDGLRLLATLRAGRVDVLLELFPHIQELLSQHTGNVAKTANNGQLEAIRHELEALKHSILVQSPPVENTSKPGGLKALAAPAIRKPVFDDDDSDLLTLKKDTSTQSSQNFLDSCFALQG